MLAADPECFVKSEVCRKSAESLWLSVSPDRRTRTFVQRPWASRSHVHVRPSPSSIIW